MRYHRQLYLEARCSTIVPRTRGARSADTQVRIAAARLIRNGMRQRAVARKLGVHPSTISRWWARFRKGGFNALAPRPVPGRPTKLSPDQVRRIREVLQRPPGAFGFAEVRWSLALIAEFIARYTGVRLHPSHVGRLFPRRGR